MTPTEKDRRRKERRVVDIVMRGYRVEDDKRELADAMADLIAKTDEDREMVVRVMLEACEHESQRKRFKKEHNNE